MKLKLKSLFTSVAAVMTLGLLSSCGNGLLDTNTNNGNAYLSFGFVKGETEASTSVKTRTVNPTFTASDLTDITITATSTASGSQEETLVSDVTYSELGSSKIILEEGTYNFKATAQLGQYTYSGSVENKTISSGTNSLSFSLTKAGSISGVTGQGTYSITLDVTDSTVKVVKATLMDFDDEETLVAEAALTAGTDGTYTYNGDIDAGDYTVIFKFYGDDDAQYEVGSYIDVVNVAPGFTSSASFTIDSVNSICTI